jgi:hypothetical protein
MKKLVLALLTITLLAPTSPALASENEGESSAQACTDPYNVWGYSTEEMSYEVEIDRSGCEWWDGSPIRLDVTLARLDAEGETIADVVTLCGVGPRLDYGEPRAREHATCETAVSLEHPGVELARYRGEVTYPGPDGDQTTGFTAFCTSPALTCQDPHETAVD